MLLYLPDRKPQVFIFSLVFVIYASYVLIGECYSLYDTNLLDVNNKAQIKRLILLAFSLKRRTD